MRNILCLFVLISFLSCQKQETGTPVQTITLDLHVDQQLLLSEIADSIEIISLEQTDESDIAHINRIISYKDYYYIFQTIMFSNGSVLVFDKDGRFVRRIDKKGGGPGEYVDLHDMAIDSYRDELVLMTQPKGVFRYTLEGEYIDKVDAAFANNLMVDGNGNYYVTPSCYDNAPYRLLMVNDEDSIAYGKVEKKHFVRVNQYFISNELEDYNGRIYYSYPLCDSIFDITGGRKTPFLYIDYNGRNLPIDELFEEGKSLKAVSKDKARYSECPRTDMFRITDDFLYVGSRDEEKHAFISLYSFKTGKTLSAHTLVDDVLFPKNNFSFKYFQTPLNVDDDGWLLWTVRPSWLLKPYQFFKEKLSPEKWADFCNRNPKLVDVCSKLDEESNPVLLKIKVKDF